MCKCGEIAVDGGIDHFRCSARDFSNLLRIDDDGNTVVPRVVDKDSAEAKEVKLPKPTKKELVSMLHELIKSYDGLPQQAMTLPINHSDFSSALFLIASILGSED